MSKIIKKIKECGGCAKRREWMRKQKEKIMKRREKKNAEKE